MCIFVPKKCAVCRNWNSLIQFIALRTEYSFNTCATYGCQLEYVSVAVNAHLAGVEAKQYKRGEGGQRCTFK